MTKKYIIYLKGPDNPTNQLLQRSQADVKMRWERQEGKEMVQDRLGERGVCVCKFVYAKVLCVKELYVTKLCKRLCVKEMYVTKLCVKELCVKELCVTKSCVKELCVTKLCVKGLCDQVVCERNL